VNAAVVGVGSNINPHQSIRQALGIIQAEMKLVRTSSFVFTKPIGSTSQDYFLNGAVLVETNMDAHGFTAYLKDVEDRLGRVRTQDKFGPRTIDLDVVLWNGSVVDDDYTRESFYALRLPRSVHCPRSTGRYET